jgi:exodeoxyribonuclease VII large subunit
LEALSPVKILERGYALVFDANGTLIKDPAQAVPGTEITARVARGSFTAEVKSNKQDERGRKPVNGGNLGDGHSL